MTHRVTVKVAGLQPVQVLAALTGIAFVVFGVVGFTRTGATGDDHAFVLGFSVNPMHNALHVAVGVLGLLMAMRSGLSRLYGWLLLLGYGAVFVWGLMIAGVLTANPVSGLGNPLALNAFDNWLHLGIAVLGLFMAVLPARRKLIEMEDEPVASSETDVPENDLRDTDVREKDVREKDVPEPRAARDARPEPITKEQAVIDPATEKLPKPKDSASSIKA
ncbi:DUF4383 domain-containing protein [Lentzea tibetensis]|uniref:DUF4383 domain-containing protein n=1 Tax=Lentzea tibetensis TaxID=2591470 RepID=A0A563EX00_9PSEU|nr:DUF4383 domain-containing protein [Lentzea tibetensis]TWP52225.1 DUF4383 domain-containing protein [Lentzea tibetensis]